MIPKTSTLSEKIFGIEVPRFVSLLFSSKNIDRQKASPVCDWLSQGYGDHNYASVECGFPNLHALRPKTWNAHSTQ